MAVEARFECTRKAVIDEASVSIQMNASIRGRDNTEWAPYTPAGTILLTVNGPAGGQFVQGGRYRVLIQELAADE